MTLESLFVARRQELQRLGSSETTASYVCPHSTPVLFFGQLENATLLTVGINPSWQEFLSEDLVSLTGNERRFAHETDLVGNESSVAEIALHRMRGYFSSSPDVAYWRWFRPIERLAQAFGCSLIEGSAAHTDVLSCFATYPAWSRLHRSVHVPFAASGYETFLEILAAAPKVKQVFVLGPRARKTLAQRSGLIFKAIPTPFDTEQKFRSFLPVFSMANWRLPSGRRLRVVAVAPYRNVPLSPLSADEIAAIPSYL